MAPISSSIAGSKPPRWRPLKRGRQDPGPIDDVFRTETWGAIEGEKTRAERVPINVGQTEEREDVNKLLKSQRVIRLVAGAVSMEGTLWTGRGAWEEGEIGLGASCEGDLEMRMMHPQVARISGVLSASARIKRSEY